MSRTLSLRPADPGRGRLDAFIHSRRDHRNANVLVVAIVRFTLAFSFGAPGSRSLPQGYRGRLRSGRDALAFARSLCWIGVGVRGIVMGRIAERGGVLWTVIFGAAMVCAGLAISSLGKPWHLFVGHGLFIGLIGNSGINAPLYVYVSKWFDRHRGSALALISSGVISRAPYGRRCSSAPSPRWAGGRPCGPTGCSRWP
jgi:hypothetical protein